jgi:hypothetical protein
MVQNGEQMVEVQTGGLWKHRKRWALVLMGLLVMLGFVGWRLSASSGVKQQVAELKKRGLPTTAVELDLWYTNVAALDNAALEFLEAYRTYNSPGTNNPSEMKAEEMVVGHPLPPKLAEAVEALVSKNGEAIELVHRAAELRKSRYPMDLTKGWETLLPHLAQLKQLAQLMKWDAIRHSRMGNREAALKSVRSGLLIAASLENEPLYISQMVRIAAVSIMVPALERVVSEQALTEDQLREMMELLAGMEATGRAGLKRGLAGDRGGAIPMFDMNFRTFEAIMAGWTLPAAFDAMHPSLRFGFYELTRATGLRDRDLAFHLATMAEIDGTLDRDYPEMIQRAEEIQTRVNEELAAHPIRYMVSALILPTVAVGLRKEAMLVARLRCVRAALAVERYRLKHGGALPSSLKELSPEFLPEVLENPVTGEALRYERISGGYRVVAEGVNEAKKKSDQSDVSFTVLRK